MSYYQYNNNTCLDALSAVCLIKSEAILRYTGGWRWRAVVAGGGGGVAGGGSVAGGGGGGGG